MEDVFSTLTPSVLTGVCTIKEKFLQYMIKTDLNNVQHVFFTNAYDFSEVDFISFSLHCLHVDDCDGT